MDMQQYSPAEYREFLLFRWHHVSQQKRLEIQKQTSLNIRDIVRLKEIYWQDIIIEEYLQETEEKCSGTISGDDVGAMLLPVDERHDGRSLIVHALVQLGF